MRDVSLVVNAFHRKGFHFDMSNLTIQVWWVGGTSLNLPWIIFCDASPWFPGSTRCNCVFNSICVGASFCISDLVFALTVFLFLHWLHQCIGLDRVVGVQ